MGNEINSESKFIGKWLSKEVDDHRLNMADIAKFLGCTAGAVSRWKLNKNGANREMQQKLAFMFNVGVDEINDTGKAPDYHASLPMIDLKSFAEEITHTVETYQINDRAFAIDVKRNAMDYLGETTPPPKKTPDNPVLRPEHKKALDEANNVTGPSSPAPKASTKADKIRLMLKNMETIRKENNLTWVIKDDGSLGATRVTVEEF